MEEIGTAWRTVHSTQCEAAWKARNAVRGHVVCCICVSVESCEKKSGSRSLRAPFHFLHFFSLPLGVYFRKHNVFLLLALQMTYIYYIYILIEISRMPY